MGPIPDVITPLIKMVISMAVIIMVLVGVIIFLLWR